MRCDLHVHTFHSGMCTVPGLSRVCRESWNDPRELYATLKSRGMDLVTVTDHDSSDAVEELRRYPDFFLSSEEVTCTLPSGTEMHAGVYGINEKDHTELQRGRHDVESLLSWVNQRRLFVTVNHLYSSLTGPRTESDFELFARAFHGIETLNGQMLNRSNRMAAEFAGRFGKPPVAGSASHTLHGAGRTWTEVRGAETAADFLRGVRCGRGIAEGQSGDWWELTLAVTDIGATMIRVRPAAALLGLLLPLVPLVVLSNYLREHLFAWQWSRRHRLGKARTGARPAPPDLTGIWPYTECGSKASVVRASSANARPPQSALAVPGVTL